MLVERHPATTVQYKFRGISPRSMEIFRSHGVEDAVRARESADQSYEIARALNLADPNVQWSGLAWPDTSTISPIRPATRDWRGAPQRSNGIGAVSHSAQTVSVL